MTTIRLKKNEDRRIRGGHPWVFSNEIERIDGSPAIDQVTEQILAVLGAEPAR